jgi:hypothetical protein
MVAAALAAGCDPRASPYFAAGSGASGGGGGAGVGGVGGVAEMRMTFEFTPPLSHKLDMLWVVDRSPSMAAFQDRLGDQVSILFNVLKGLPSADGTSTGLPDIHVAVISSDTGTGRYDVPTLGCTVSGDGGRFQTAPRGHCAQSPIDPATTPLRFLAASNNQQQKNYRGDISDALACLLPLGTGGCAISSPLKALRWALDPLNVPPGNEGFLRPDASLAVAILSDQDDCSLPPNSPLMDPSQDSLADPLGPLTTFRCNEFGHQCLVNGVLQPPSRRSAETLTGCQSNESATGMLTRVGDEATFLRGLKDDRASPLSACRQPCATATLRPPRSTPIARWSSSPPGRVGRRSARRSPAATRRPPRGPAGSC